MTVFKKISEKIRESNLPDDIRMLFDTNVSVRFRILNMLSGDRIRPLLAFANASLKDALKEFDWIAEYRLLNDGVVEDGMYACFTNAMAFYIEKAKRDIEELSQI